MLVQQYSAQLRVQLAIAYTSVLNLFTESVHHFLQDSFGEDGSLVVHMTLSMTQMHSHNHNTI